MTKIESSRIAELFQKLSVQKNTVKASRNAASEPVSEYTAEPVPQRSADVLKRQLKDRLSRLKSESGEFETESSLVAVREILIWEFGEGISSHPEFKAILKSVVDTIEQSEGLNTHMNKLIASLLR